MDPSQALGEQGQQGQGRQGLRLEKAEEARQAFAASGAKDLEVLGPQRETWGILTQTLGHWALASGKCSQKPYM